VKRTFAVSSIIHIAFLTAILAPAFNRIDITTADVINVKLVAPERKAPQPVKQAPPKQEQVVEKEEQAKPKMAYKPEKKPDPPKPKKTTAPKETKPKTSSEKPPPAETAKEDEAAAPAKTDAGATVRVDDKDFRFAYYLEIIKERISGNWSPPPITGTADGMISTVYFKISRDGTVSDIKVEESSNLDLFDRSATRAVNLSNPLPPLPAGFKGKWLGVHFEFERKSG
jgi:TonB family protein